MDSVRLDRPDPAQHPERGRPGCGQPTTTLRTAGLAARVCGIETFKRHKRETDVHKHTSDYL